MKNASGADNYYLITCKIPSPLFGHKSYLTSESYYAKQITQMRLSRSPQRPQTGPEESQVQKSLEIQQILVPRQLPQLIVRLK